MSVGWVDFFGIAYGGPVLESCPVASRERSRTKALDRLSPSCYSDFTSVLRGRRGGDSRFLLLPRFAPGHFPGEEV